MRKLSLILLIAIIVMFAGCSGSPDSGIVIPSWLQDEWYDTDGDPYRLVFSGNNIMIYENGQLVMDIGSNLQLYPHVEISSQGSTDTTYQLTLLNTSTHQYMYITVRYTASSDTILFDYSAGLSGLIIPAARKQRLSYK